MNLRTFLKKFEQSADRDRMVDAVYDEFAHYCRENDIGEDDISTPVLRRMAEGFVERGFTLQSNVSLKRQHPRFDVKFGVPESEETVTSTRRFLSEEDRQALDDFRQIDDATLERLKTLHKEGGDEWVEELGTATDGSESDV